MEPFVPQRLPLDCIQWDGLITHISKSNRALAQYDGTLYGVPNADLLLSPLTTQEAVLSSKIEGTHATLSEVLEFEVGQKADDPMLELDIGEILNYRRALRLAEESLQTRPFSLALLRQLHEVLLDSVRGNGKTPGEFRRVQNWIGSPGSTPATAAFVPPAPVVLRESLDNWEAYYHMNAPDGLVQMAIVHAQFEILHPFLDGNGRLGRILIPLFLYEKKLLHRPMFYLSEWLEMNRSEYMAGLRGISQDKDGWNHWIRFFLTGIEQQALSNSAKARGVIDLYNRTKATLMELTDSKFAVPMLDQMFRLPVFKSSNLTFKPQPTAAVVNTLIRKARDAGIIQVVAAAAGTRAGVYKFTELLTICEQWAGPESRA